MTEDAKQRWFAELMKAGLEEEIFGARDVLDHVSPEVLAKHMPAELLGQVLDAALSASSMTPERVLETLDPAALARHIPLPLLWACVTAAAERRGIASAPADA